MKTSTVTPSFYYVFTISLSCNINIPSFIRNLWWVLLLGNHLKKESIVDVRTHFKPTETFQYTHFSSCHPPGVRRSFIKGEALRLLRTNSSKATFEENITQFKSRLRDRGQITHTLSGIKFSKRTSALQNKPKTRKRILPFVTEYGPSVPNLKNILMSKWPLIENQPLLR